MNIFKSLTTLAYIVIVISSCEDRSIKGAHRNDNAAQVNEVAAVSQPSDSMKGPGGIDTESDITGFYKEVILEDAPLTTYKRLRLEREVDWIGHLMSIDLSEFSSDISDSLNVFSSTLRSTAIL